MNKELSVLQHLNPLHSEATKPLKTNFFIQYALAPQGTHCFTTPFGVTGSKGLRERNPTGLLHNTQKKY
jgi:hypothetical protein